MTFIGDEYSFSLEYKNIFAYTNRISIETKNLVVIFSLDMLSHHETH